MNHTIYYRFNGKSKMQSTGVLPSLGQYSPNKVKEIILHNHINAKELEKALFPVPKNVIFISHLHKDVDYVRQVRNKIQTSVNGRFQCFIDSDVWGNVYDVILSLAGEIRQKNGSLNFKDHDDISKNMYMILSLALQRVISECFLFVFVPPAVHDEKHPNIFNTHSPWVCQELFSSSLFPSGEILMENMTKSSEIKSPEIQFTYDAPLNHLTRTTLDEFITSLVQCLSL